MASALQDPDVRAVVDHYRTCELATLSRSGAPIAWPTTHRYDPERGTFLLTTSIGFPQKVHNIRRDPRVGLLFSDPTGSGLHDRPQVLVQGEASCTTDIVTAPSGVDGLEEWWQRLWSMQPSGRSIGADPVTRRLMDWYYRRIVITVHPTRVQVRAPLPPAGGRAADPGSRAGSTSGEAFRLLSQFDSGVLAARDANGAPWLLRVRIGLDARAGTLAVLGVPDDEPVQPGPASILVHRHDEDLGGLRSGVVVGELRRRVGGRDDGRDGSRDVGWALVPTRLVPGAEQSPAGLVRLVVGCRRSARAYVERRHLATPPVDWAAFAALKAQPASHGAG